MWREHFQSAISFIKELYERYLYLIMKPLIVLFFLVLFFKLISFVGMNVIGFIDTFVKATLPFLLGIGISFLLEPANKFLSLKCKFPRVLAVLTTLLVSISMILSTIALVLYLAVKQIIKFSNDLIGFVKSSDGTAYSGLLDKLSNNSFLSKFISQDDFDKYLSYAQENITTISKALLNVVSSLGGSFGSFLSNFFLGVLPTLSIVVLIAIITSFFMSKDKDLMLQTFEKYTPKAIHDAIFKIKTEAVKNFFRYMRGQLILVSISAVIFLIAFLIIRSPYAFALALLVLFLDLLPVIGTIVLVLPWAVYAFFTGDVFTGYTLLISYVFATVLRQIIEPKIMADSLGFHPLLLLVSLYLGIQFFGGIGVLVGPVLLILIKILFDTGILKK